ncbi:MAG: hypothetical protein GY750_21045 [Lentisphaerae bacterium]|nr:hypothetical protein [Lentisphaerota bacterium]
MSTYNTPYASGTIDSVSSSTITVSGVSPVMGWVGRIFILTSGSGKLQHREVLSVSGQDVTLAHSFDTAGFLGITDINPSNGDTFAISYDMADLISSDSDLIKTGKNNIEISAIEIYGNAYIHANKYDLEFNASDIEIGNGGGLILGYYNPVSGEDGYVKNTCNITDESIGTGGNQMGRGTSSGDDFGLFEMYGGSLYAISTNFWRLYDSASSDLDQNTRIINVGITGKLGSRIGGEKSIIIASSVGNINAFGLSNFLNLSRIELSIYDSYQCVFINRGLGPTGRAILNRISDISDHVARITSSGSGVYEIIAKKSEIDATPAFINNGSSDSNHITRFGNMIRPSYIDSTGSLIIDNIKTFLFDKDTTQVNTEVVSNGHYTEYLARHTDVICSAVQTYNLSDGTLYAPYELNSFSFGKSIVSQSLSIEDTFEDNTVLLDDVLLVEKTKATIDAYTELETSEKLYDRAYSYLYDNYTGEAKTIVDRSDKTIDAGSFDIEVNSNASSAFAFNGSKITIKASLFTGNITTTGDITLLNGAEIIGTTIDSSGTKTTVGYSITNLVPNSRVQLFNVTTGTEIVNVIEAGTSLSGTYTEGVNISTGDDIRIRLTNVNGLVAYMEYESVTSADSNGFSFLINQELCPVYTALNVDGSTVTNFTADYTNDEVDIIVDSDYLASHFYAWWVYNLYSEEGIREFFGGIYAPDEGNFRINNSIVNILLDNTTSTNVSQQDNRRIYREDDARPVKEPTTGGGGVDVEWRSPVLIANSDYLNDKITEVNESQMGDWEMENNQLIMKKVNGDLLKTFDLFDKAGNPTTDGAFKREGI